MEHGYAVRSALLDQKISEEEIWSTLTIGLPHLKANVNYTHAFELQKSLIPAAFVGGSPGEFVEVAFGTTHSMTVSSTLSQVLLDVTYFLSLITVGEIRELNKKIVDKTKIELKKATALAYISVLLAQESLKITEKNVELAEKSYLDADTSYKYGVIEQQDAEQFRLNYTRLRTELFKLRRQIIDAERLLKLAMGLDINKKLELTETLSDLYSGYVDFSPLYSGLNIENNVDISLQQSMTELQRINYKYNLYTLFPTITANLGGNVAAFQNNFILDDLGDVRYLRALNLSVNVNIPIFDSFQTMANIEKAYLQYDKERLKLHQTEQQTKADAEKFKNEYQASIDDYNNTLYALQLAQSIYDKEKVKFEEGITTSISYTQAQNQLYQAQILHLQAMFSIIRSKLDLDKITNSL